jgi:esterase/lipase superfamily enzyme
MSTRILLRWPIFCAALLQLSACMGGTSAVPLVAELDIPFLTTRGVETLADGEIDYSTDLAELSAGQCEVTLLRGDEIEADNGRIASRELEQVLSGFAGRPDPQILIYVHGYNIGLERACRDAARLARATGFENRILLFSWPASRTLLTYRKDEQRLAASTPAIVSALHDMGTRYGYENINILAHSMGTRIVLALDGSNGMREPPATARFARLILVAPDIDRDAFLKAAPGIVKHAENVSILVSEDDKLLLLSQLVNQDERLGQATDLSVQGIEVLDVSDFEKLGFTGHIYHLENTRVGELLRRILGSPGDA